MKKILLSASLLFATAQAWAAKGPIVGQPAPGFTTTDSNNQTHSLADFAGKYVVLEWWNQDCPYVKKHYSSGNMQGLQSAFTLGEDKNKDQKGKAKDAKATAKDGKEPAKAPEVVWLTILSSAPGKQGFMDGPKVNEAMKTAAAAPSFVLLDPKGEIGRKYEAKTTPHMFVIDPKGILVYMGAIDSKPTTDAADITGATNYVKGALMASIKGEKIDPSVTKPYGCSVKY